MRAPPSDLCPLPLQRARNRVRQHQTRSHIVAVILLEFQQRRLALLDKIANHRIG